MSAMFGGEKAWKVRVKGDVVVAYHWINNEPAMVLFKRGAGTAMNPGAYVLPLESAFKYADSKTGGPTRYAIQQAATAARVMGFFPDRFIITRIVDVIMEGLLDLIEMPPEPTGLNAQQTEAIGEMSLKADGQIVHECEVDENLVAVP